MACLYTLFRGAEPGGLNGREKTHDREEEGVTLEEYSDWLLYESRRASAVAAAYAILTSTP